MQKQFFKTREQKISSDIFKIYYGTNRSFFNMQPAHRIINDRTENYGANIVFISKQHCRNEEYLSRREVIPLSSPLHPLAHPPTTPIPYPNAYRSAVKGEGGRDGTGAKFIIPLYSNLFCHYYNSVSLLQNITKKYFCLLGKAGGSLVFLGRCHDNWPRGLFRMVHHYSRFRQVIFRPDDQINKFIKLNFKIRNKVAPSFLSTSAYSEAKKHVNSYQYKTFRIILHLFTVNIKVPERYSFTRKSFFVGLNGYKYNIVNIPV